MRPTKKNRLISLPRIAAIIAYENLMKIFRLHRESYLSHLPTSVVALSAVFVLAPGSARGISFVLNDVTPGGMSPAALAGFQQATTIWQSWIANAITVNLDIRFDANDFSGSPFGASTLGSASSTSQGSFYTDVRNALTLKSTSGNDAIAVAGLPAGASLSFLTNDPNTSAVVTDNNGSANNSILDINTANAKALGLRDANDAGTDAQIAFNNTFSWDFDQSDGVGAGLQDFVGVTVHEIGHALGFVSGVDTVDLTHGAGPFAGTSLDPFRVFSVLDLFRYSEDGQLNFASGGTPYFSIDGGATNLAAFSTGPFNGDGRQASHWKDNLGIGIMDPTANSPGSLNTLSSIDLVAFDVIGYQLIPESSSALLGAIGLLCIVSRRRR